MAKASTAPKAAEFTASRGVNVGGTGLFQDGDGLVMYPTKAMAAAHAKRWGWGAKYVCRVHTALFAGYAVAQFGQQTITFLKEDGTTLEYPFFEKKRLALSIS